MTVAAKKTLEYRKFHSTCEAQPQGMSEQLVQRMLKALTPPTPDRRSTRVQKTA